MHEIRAHPPYARRSQRTGCVAVPDVHPRWETAVVSVWRIPRRFAPDGGLAAWMAVPSASRLPAERSLRFAWAVGQAVTAQPAVQHVPAAPANPWEVPLSSAEPTARTGQVALAAPAAPAGPRHRLRYRSEPACSEISAAGTGTWSSVRRRANRGSDRRTYLPRRVPDA